MTGFTNRHEGGRLLAAALGHLRGADVVVVGLPRGGVPVAYEVACALGAPLDVIVVRKLGVPYQPELAMGAIGEDGVRVVNDDVVRHAGVSAAAFAAVEARERTELARRALLFRSGRRRIPLAGRVVVVVDDGVATGSTAAAACRVARAEGARRVILAVPVAPTEWAERLAGAADELVCLLNPHSFFGVGQFYDDFGQTSDAEVAACLERAAERPSAEATRDEEMQVVIGPLRLAGHLTAPSRARGLVLFAHGSGSSRLSPRNRYVASVLNEAGLATLLFDLLTTDEEADRANVFDIALLAARLEGAMRHLGADPVLGRLPIGLFGASTGAAAALWAAAEPAAGVAAVVSRGGRPDLAGQRLREVRAPTLLIVGGRDTLVLDLNRQAQARLRCESRLEIVPSATHLFEEPGTLQAAARLARDWFLRHLGDPESSEASR